MIGRVVAYTGVAIALCVIAAFFTSQWQWMILLLLRPFFYIALRAALTPVRIWSARLVPAGAARRMFCTDMEGMWAAAGGATGFAILLALIYSLTAG